MKKMVNRLKNYFNAPVRRIIFSLSLMPLFVALFFSMTCSYLDIGDDLVIYGFSGFWFIWGLYFLAKLAIGKDVLNDEVNKARFEELFFLIFKWVLIAIIFGVILDCLASGGN